MMSRQNEPEEGEERGFYIFLGLVVSIVSLTGFGLIIWFFIYLIRRYLQKQKLRNLTREIERKNV